MSEWIKIEGPETLPEPWLVVWGTDGKKVRTVYRSTGEWHWYDQETRDYIEDCGKWTMDHVTHWMPFVKPATPTGKE